MERGIPFQNTFHFHQTTDHNYVQHELPHCCHNFALHCLAGLNPLEYHQHHNRFTALFPGPPGWAGARRELLDFMVQAKINRGRHTDHLAGRHSIQTNQCRPPPSPHIFTGRMPFLPPNQQRQSTEGPLEYLWINFNYVFRTQPWHKKEHVGFSSDREPLWSLCQVSAVRALYWVVITDCSGKPINTGIKMCSPTSLGLKMSENAEAPQ